MDYRETGMVIRRQLNLRVTSEYKWKHSILCETSPHWPQGESPSCQFNPSQHPKLQAAKHKPSLLAWSHTESFLCEKCRTHITDVWSRAIFTLRYEWTNITQWPLSTHQPANLEDHIATQRLGLTLETSSWYLQRFKNNFDNIEIITFYFF